MVVGAWQPDLVSGLASLAIGLADYIGLISAHGLVLRLRTAEFVRCQARYVMMRSRKQALRVSYARITPNLILVLVNS